jgi:hypothetical protein
MEADLIYFRRRSVQEAAAAAGARDAKVRAVHLELARRYDERVAALAAEMNVSQLHLITAA